MYAIETIKFSSAKYFLLAVTLGTTYVDDHVKTESASMYIGCIYSMAAFGPVLGFLLGAYLLSFHMDSLSGTLISIGEEAPSHYSSSSNKMFFQILVTDVGSVCGGVVFCYVDSC